MKAREARLSDIPMIRSIAFAAWPVAYAAILSPDQLSYMLELMYSEPALREQMQVKGHRFLLLDVDRGECIGFAGFEHCYAQRSSTRLHKLYLLPQAKGAGNGAVLLNAVEEAARVAGDSRIELNVNRFNPAKDWYMRRGFRIQRDEVIDIGRGYVMDDHVLVKDLR